jgi:hypothetical protein
MVASAVAPPRRAYDAAARCRGAAVCVLIVIGFAAPARADKISHPTAVFEGLDKITGRIFSFEVAIDETVQFGMLQITPRVCYSRPTTDAPQTDVFAEVDEIDEKKEEKRIFSGWMFADSPGLHGIEHPIYDIWLKGCKGGTTVIHEAPTVEASAPDQNAFPGETTDSNPAQAPDAQAPAAPPKKRKPKPATVIAAPAPAPAPENAPLELGGAPSGSPGNARAR